MKESEEDATLGHFPSLIQLGAQYIIKVEDISIPLNSCSLIMALGYLTAIYFVLRLKYCPRVGSIFVFFLNCFWFLLLSTMHVQSVSFLMFVHSFMFVYVTVSCFQFRVK